VFFLQRMMCARIYLVHAEEGVVVFFRTNNDQWSGLNDEGNPFIFCKSVDHVDSGALKWTLQVGHGTVTAIERHPIWVDMSHRIPATQLRDVSKLEWRVFRDISGDVASKWRINNKFIYEDNQISTYAKNAVLDSMIEPLY